MTLESREILILFLFFVDGSADKVGIGTSTPTALLDVDGTIKTKVHTIGALPSASPAGAKSNG
jgi:hypothetical protein